MRPSTLFFLPILLLVLSGAQRCKNPYQQKCQEICSFYTSCVEQQFPKTIGTDEKQKSFIAIECESGCLREQGFAVPCYEAEKTCVGFTRCLMESGLMD
ncbi:Cys-rich protein [Leptospira wolffii]|uniref:Cys-rich protein n=1 Tax=Leptospira wolffii TaxID=409998 RepID=UPI00030F7D3B|nr:Cys-rich protein [Leptospira wolffii]EPG64118.1 hypothetical protein LEP1GSC061_3849 [Leptospira wolffii serovar Khorat str. Khorat-H2]